MHDKKWTRSDWLIFGGAFVAIAFLVATFVVEPLYAATWQVVKSREVRVISTSDAFIELIEADGNTHAVSWRLTDGDEFDFYTSNLVLDVEFVSSNTAWMNLEGEGQGTVKPSFPNGITLLGVFSGTGGVHTGSVSITVAGTAAAYQVKNTSDSSALNFQIVGDGKMTWGVASSLNDTNLYRCGVDALCTDGTFTFGAGLLVDQTTLTATTLTLDADDYIVLVDDDTAGSTVTLTLPACATHVGHVYHVKKLGTTADVVVDGNSSETIDGGLTATLATQYEAISIVCDASNWSIF